MLKTAGIVFIFLLTGCATTLTEAGRKIKVIHSTESESVANCKQLGVVKGETRSFLTSGDYGLFYATNDARNKAALIPEADTLVIGDSESRRLGGQITGIAYRCNVARSRTLPKVPVPVDDIAEKSRKCRAKGGIWRDNQCVIPID